MKFSEAWLREWVNPDLSIEVLVEHLTLAGLEVGDIHPVASPLKGIKVARIVTVTLHPEVDHLKICHVDIGESSLLKVVCGAPNAQAELLVPLAIVGAQLPTGEKIDRAEFYGIESFGMLCSAAELGLGEQSIELLVFSSDASQFLGMDLDKFLQLNDVSIEIELTPNRSDCLSIAGIAREVGVLTQCTVMEPTIESAAIEIKDVLPVIVAAPEACPRYLGRIVRGINPQAQTPWWIRERLRRSGIRSLGVVVDITNYVMLELGQPMHAFDLEKLDEGIQVRYGFPNELLVLLDGTQLQLDTESLVIADRQRALALAGIMGGVGSAISEQTRHVFLESAFFTPNVIAGKGRSYGLHTDSSHRFERGVDPALPRRALERATALLIQAAGGQAGPVTEVTNSAYFPPQITINLRLARIYRVLGIEISKKQIFEQLTRLGLELDPTEEGWRVKVPSFRFDLTVEADLIEELGRLYGYDRLPSTQPISKIRPPLRIEAETPVDRIRQILVSRGYQEAITYSFVDPQLQQLLDPKGDSVILANPISADMAVMRTTLWPGLIQALRYNLHRQQERVRLFEYGLTFNGRLPNIRQEKTIAGIVSGSWYPEQWGLMSQEADFFDLKGDLEAILGLGCDRGQFEFIADRHSALHPRQSARISRKGQIVGWLGAVHPALVKDLDLAEHVYLFSLQIGAIENYNLSLFQPLSKFPAIRRDIAFLVSKDIPAQAIFDCFQRLELDILREYYLFDLYSGKGVAPDKKSFALKLILQHSSCTLTDDMIKIFMERIVAMLITDLSAIIRE